MTDAMIKRIMPHDIEAEQSVIGSMIMDREAIGKVSEVLTKEDFYDKRYGLLFEAITGLHNNGKPVDMVTIRARLSELNAPDDMMGMEYMIDIVNNTYTSANVKVYADIVAEKAILRRLIKFCENTINHCYNPSESVGDILAETEKKVFNMVSYHGAEDYIPIRKRVVDTLEHLSRISKMKGEVTGIATGFTDLDYKLSGLQPSDLILVAARPSVGKTAFVLNIARHICFKLDLRVALFSLEMSGEQLINRLLAMESGVNAKTIRNASMNDSEWMNIIEEADTIARSNLIIDDTSNISIKELRSKCRKYHQEQKLSVVIIDYLQLMSGEGRPESRQLEIASISRSLKALARELHVPVIALSQLSRAVEKREDKRPMLSDLRDSGAIEQDADVVMFLHREEYYDKTSDKVGETEVMIAKQRNGPIGMVKLAWIPEYTRFANLK